MQVAHNSREVQNNFNEYKDPDGMPPVQEIFGWACVFIAGVLLTFKAFF